MRARITVSLCSVVGLTILSIVALACTTEQVPTETLSNQRVETKAAVVTVVPEYTSEPTTASGTQPPEEETEQEVYHSKIASMDWDAEDAYLLAKIAMAEAESEDTEGKALVILVVLNRVWNDEFPDTIEDVIYQPGQFSPVANGRFDSVEPDDDCWKALELIELEKWDESMGATYFESKSKSTWHSENLKFLFQHGNHYFYEERE